MSFSRSRIAAVTVAVLTATTASACRGQGTSQGGGGSADGGAADATGGISLPAEVQRPSSVCTLKTELFVPLVEHPVRASGSTAPYVKVGTPGILGLQRFDLRADLALPGDEDLPFSLRLLSGNAELHGFVERTFPLHAGGPLALGAFAAALPHTELRVLRATALEVEAEVQVGESVEVVGEPLRARGPCGLFAIERRDFMPTEVIPGAKWKNTPGAKLKLGRKIPVTKLPAGEAVVRIQVKENDNPAVAVFEREQGRAHIGWFGSIVMIHGWVAASDLDPLTDAGAPAADAGAPAAKKPTTTTPVSPVASERLSCPAAVPLVAKVGDSRTTVGTLRPSGTFDVISREKDWAEVRVHIPLVTVTEGTRLLVRESDLAACKPQPKKDEPR
jgi:hypothetical protein